MWLAYLSLKMYHRRPSEDLAVTDTIAAWCLDGAVLWFGITIENALSERVNKGTPKEPRYEARYTLMELLDPAFHLPRPQPEPRKVRSMASDGLASFLAMAGQPGGGVKMFRYVGPPV